MIELWQTEWCPASRRVRQRLTELQVDYVARQVAVEPERRTLLEAATGSRSVPVLVAGGEVVAGEREILAHLAARFPEPLEAGPHREKAAKARRRDLEDACPQLQAATH